MPNRQLSVSERASNIRRILGKLSEPRGVFIVDGAFRTCSLSDYRLERAMTTFNIEFVGVYDSRVLPEHLEEDMAWSMARYKLWRL